MIKLAAAFGYCIVAGVVAYKVKPLFSVGYMIAPSRSTRDLAWLYASMLGLAWPVLPVMAVREYINKKRP